jgi:hypothetical protein
MQFVPTSFIVIYQIAFTFSVTLSASSSACASKAASRFCLISAYERFLSL